jgi:glycogen synthase
MLLVSCQVGAHPAIAGQTHKFMGIRNGIDTELWSPTENKFLPMPYDAETAEEGKRRWGWARCCFVCLSLETRGV